MPEQTPATVPAASAPASAGPWPVLDLRERRVLGVLVEKQKTSKSADTYPLSLNSLTTGCNQKSNRDPVLNLEEEEVEETLLRCLKRNLVARVTSTRVMRWRHLLYEAWHVEKIDLAILAELLLRGPQTEGELRTHVNRMDPLDDLETLRTALKPLVERKLVVYVTPEDRRGAAVTHGFHDPRELDRIKAHFASQPVSASEPVRGAAPASPGILPVGSSLLGELERIEARVVPLEGGLNTVNTEIAALKKTVSDMQSIIARLQQELNGLKQSLGG